MNRFKVYKRLALVQVPGVQSVTLTGALTIDPALHSQFLKLDPGGASRDITLPGISISKGVFYNIVNAADQLNENLVIKNAAGDIIVTLNQNESTWVVCSETAWTFTAVQTIALS